MENNPYQTPESDIEQTGDLKRSVWWKLYFFLITILTAMGMAIFFAEPEVGIAEYLYLPIWIIGTVGFFGFVFIKPVHKPEFWLKLFFFYVAYTIIYYFITDIDQQMDMSDMEYYISTAIGWIISIPAYYALYAYSNPSYPAWKNA